jgi:signal peptidase II
MRWFLTFIPVILSLDQYSKWLIRQHIPTGGRIEIIEGFFNLTHVQNPGAAFGLLRDLDPAYRNPFFFGISLFAFLILLYLYRQTLPQEWRMRAILAIIFGGALGNVTDRILFGTVTDFLDVYYRDYHWANFNVADSCISIGVGLLFLEMIFFSRREQHLRHSQFSAASATASIEPITLPLDTTAAVIATEMIPGSAKDAE